MILSSLKMKFTLKSKTVDYAKTEVSEEPLEHNLHSIKKSAWYYQYKSLWIDRHHRPNQIRNKQYVTQTTSKSNFSTDSHLTLDKYSHHKIKHINNRSHSHPILNASWTHTISIIHIWIISKMNKLVNKITRWVQ